MAGPPSLLAHLRAIAPAAPDWRRDRPHPEADRIAAHVAALAAARRWPAARRAEADLLLAKARADAVAAMEALCAMAAATEDPPRRAAAMAEIAALAAEWTNIRAGWTPVDLPVLQDRAEQALAALCRHLPREPGPWLAAGAIVQDLKGPRAALARLEAGLDAGAPVLGPYFDAVVALLSHQPSAADIAHALAAPERHREAAGARWLAFRLHRSIALATAWAQPGQAIRDGRIDAAAAEALLAVPAEELHIAGRMAQALAHADRLPPAPAAGFLASLPDNLLLRFSPVPGAEAARVALVEAMLARLAQPALGPEAAHVLLLRLLRLAPCAVRFWEDPAFRLRVCDGALARVGAIPEPPRSFVRGAFAFARGEEGAAREAFAASAAAWPDAAGPGTFLEPAAVPAILRAARPGAALLGSEGGLRFATVSAPAQPPPAGTPVVAISANGRYLRLFGRAYARRLAEVSPEGGRLHIHLIGDPAPLREEIAGIAAAVPGHAVTLSDEALGIDAPYYFATARFLRLPWLLERLGGEGPLVVTDIDAPWRDPPGAFLARRFAGADVGLRLSTQVEGGRYPGMGWFVNVLPQMLPWHAVNASMMVFARTGAAARFAGWLASLADHALRGAAGRSTSGTWGIDQNLLVAAYAHAVRHDPGIRFADLGAPGTWQAERLPPFMRTPQGRHWLAGPP